MFEKLLIIVRERWQIILVVVMVIIGGCWQMSKSGGATKMEHVRAPIDSGSSREDTKVATSSNQIAIQSKKININTASSNELQKIPGVGPAKAQLIVEYRQNKHFDSIDELMNISGIGPKTFEKLRDHVTSE